MNAAQLHAAQERLDNMAPAEANETDDLVTEIEHEVSALVHAYTRREVSEVKRLASDLREMLEGLSAEVSGMEVDPS
jgi:hypothetical protein